MSVSHMHSTSCDKTMTTILEPQRAKKNPIMIRAQRICCGWVVPVIYLGAARPGSIYVWAGSSVTALSCWHGVNFVCPSSGGSPLEAQSRDCVIWAICGQARFGDAADQDRTRRCTRCSSILSAECSRSFKNYCIMKYFLRSKII